MAQSHLIALPAQELSALLRAVDAPQFASLFAQLPALRAALHSPVDDKLITLASATQEAIAEVAKNTLYPEDWDEANELAARLLEQKRAQAAAQSGAQPAPVTPREGQACTCGGQRFAKVYSKACNSNWFSIPHLGFKVDGGYMPDDLGIPGDGDGPGLSVCLDCGRVQGEKYPLSDDELRKRIAEYEGGLL